MASDQEQALSVSEIKSPYDFNYLPDFQRKICLARFAFPEATQEEIARKLKIAPASVHGFFASRCWETINSKVAQAQLQELVPLAIKTIKDCLLADKVDTKLKAAVSVLTSTGVMTSVPRTLHDNKIMVVWSDRKKDGNPDTVLAAQ